MNLVVLSSHSVLEFDDLRLFSDLGYDVFMPGGYADPSNPGENLRPALPDAPYHPEFVELTHQQRVKHDGESTREAIDWGKADLHPDIIDWADTIIVNCFPEAWIGGQWDRIRGKRVIWRTIGQSGPANELAMAPYRRQGLEIVRYSPKERTAFESIGVFAGEDAMIRFAKYPGDYEPWIGDNPVVGNVTQDLDTRGDYTGYGFWQAATKGLLTQPAGRGSERIGGLGTLSWDAMRDYLRHLRVYLYMGTQPASYTLGLMEAMLAGVPMISRGTEGLWFPDLFEASEIVSWGDAANARTYLYMMLAREPEVLRGQSDRTRAKGAKLFGAETIGQQWAAFLAHVPVAA